MQLRKRLVSVVAWYFSSLMAYAFVFQVRLRLLLLRNVSLSRDSSELQEAQRLRRVKFTFLALCAACGPQFSESTGYFFIDLM